MKTQKLRPWEMALLLALCLAFGAGLWAADTQADLSSRLIRLHVIANSDSPADQAEKLRVRDQVLALLSPLLAPCRTREEAARVIGDHQAELEALGDVTVTLGEERYPRRDYDTFSLPGGEYLSLRVVLGAGQGRNWWCVVFPPLCTEALAEPAADAFSLLPDESARLITQDGPAYVFRFRLVEWWDALCRALS